MASLLEIQSFDEILGVGAADLTRIRCRNLDVGVVNSWGSGSCASFVLGADGAGQAVRGPSNLRFDTNTSVWTSMGVKFKLKFRSAGAQDAVKMQLGAVFGGTLRKNASEQLELHAMTGTGSVLTSATVVALDTWYSAEFWWYIHDTLGRHAVYLNGGQIADLSVDNIDTRYSGGTALSQVLWNNGTIDIDDVIVMGRNGKFTDSDVLSHPTKDHKIVSLYRTANGFYTNWALGIGSGALYEQVDEVGPGDKHTTDLKSSTTDARVSFPGQALPTTVTISQILAVKTHLLGGSSWFGVGDVPYSFLRIGSSNYDAGSRIAADSVAFDWMYDGEIWETNPSNLSAWTVSAVDAVEVGAKTHSGQENWLSQVVLHVLYVTQPAPEPARISSSLVRFRKMHRLVKCWLVQRTDEVELAFTDHDHELELDGVTFEPAGGFSGSAIRRELMLKDQSQSFLGVISSGAVTVDDLRAGRYRDATIVERVVDWRYPYLGDVQRSVYWIGDVNWNGNFWKVELTGLSQRLQRKRGIVVGRTCRWDLFGPGCLVSPTPHTYPALTVASVVDRYTFLAGGLGTFADDWFTDGDITWTAGANIGLVSEVRDYVGSNDRIDLYIRTPFPITTSDTFTLRAGCDKLPTTCKTKYANFANFGGFPFIPGRNKAMRGR